MPSERDGRPRREKKLDLSPPSCSKPALNRADDVYPHWRGWTFLAQFAASDVDFSLENNHRYI